MREVHGIKIKPDSDFWKSMKEAANLDAEKAATQAAERARKETLERAERIAREKQAFLDSIRYLNKLEFKTQEIRKEIQECERRREEYRRKGSVEWAHQDELQKKLQATCTHDLVLERLTHYKDEYDSWHEGHHERKCIECFLVEESDYNVGDRSYGHGRRKFNKLEKSQAILLRKMVDGKEFELEFDDLKW